MIHDFETAIPEIKRRIFENYDNIAKKKNEPVNGPFQQALDEAVNEYRKEYGDASLSEINSKVEELRRNFGGATDANGNQLPLWMNQSQNLMKALNKEQFGYNQSGGNTG